LVAVIGRNKVLVKVFTRQLAATVIAGVASVGVWVVIVSSNVAPRIVSQTAAGPYGLITSLRELLLAAIYAPLAVLTNFGANPATGTTILRNIPRQSLATVLSINGVSVLINAAILAAGLSAVALAVRSSYIRKAPAQDVSAAATLSLMLIFSTLTAIAAYIVTKHDFAVDARYLGIDVFAVFVALAVATRKRAWSPLGLSIVGLVLLAGVISGGQIAYQSARQETAVAAPFAARNAVVAQVVANHPVDTLVGDYWRVVPTKFRSGPAAKLNILPLASCSQVRDTLTSTAWQHDLKKHSFAYLLTFDGSLTDYPRCSFAAVVAAYGSPNSSVLIAGTFDKPKEVILFYNEGINQPSDDALTVDSIENTLPVPVKQVANAVCAEEPTILNIVAHQDDDLLFMNPDIMRDIQAGKCSRTIYLTAGDAGSGRYYALKREQGSEAAYSTMLGQPQSWVQRTVKLADKQFVTVATPKNNPKLSLIFMHLPDGNLVGQGFAATHNQSLDHLNSSALKRIHSIDNQSVYTSMQLIQALTTLMNTYQPSEIRLQSAYNDPVYPDHSDHRAAGSYAQAATTAYVQQPSRVGLQIPKLFYIGYPVHGLPENVTGQDLVDSIKVFLEYAKYDGRVCQTESQCDRTPTYNAYLRTQYQAPY